MDAYIEIIVTIIIVAFVSYLAMSLFTLLVFKREFDLFALIRLFKNRAYLQRNIYDIQHSLSEISYYRNLPPNLKHSFELRVVKFILEKEFLSHPNQTIGLYHKVKIAAAAVQVTFGLNNFLLNHFTRIYLFPKAYYSPINKEFHKGEVNLNGAILLSFEDFQTGYKIEDDGINLGLHEMAHALRFDALMGDENHSLFNFHFAQMQLRGKIDFSELNHKQNSMLRKYAKANFEEFFAVCIENFFERPSQFKTEFPELFEKLCLLLNQNPENLNPLQPILANTSNKKFDPNIAERKLYYSGAFNWIHLLQFLVGFPVILFLMDVIFDNVVLNIIFLVLFPILILFRGKTFSITPTRLCIQNFLLADIYKKNIEISNITLILYNEKSPRQIFVKHVNNNQISSDQFNWRSSNKDFNEFITQLKKMNVKTKELPNSVFIKILSS
jgi:Mlc titration factor MtfA (ptsG expression regulator)